MKKKTYNTKERTIAQFKAMALKKQGCDIDKLIETSDENPDDVSVIAFGYKLSETSDVKKSARKEFKNAIESEYTFIYWN